MDASNSRCTCFLLRRAARRTSQVYDRALAPLGLSLNEYSILRRAREPAALGELAERVGMDRSTLSRNLRPMLAAGWIEQRRGEDARQRLVAASVAGRQLLRRAEPLWRRAQTQLEDWAGADAVAALHGQLQQLEDALPTAGSAHEDHGVAARRSARA